jgi:hypothetical protein
MLYGNTDALSEERPSSSPAISQSAIWSLVPAACGSSRNRLAMPETVENLYTFEVTHVVPDRCKALKY